MYDCYILGSKGRARGVGRKWGLIVGKTQSGDNHMTSVWSGETYFNGDLNTQD